VIRLSFNEGRKLLWIANEFFVRFHIVVDRWDLRRRLKELGAYKTGRRAPARDTTMLPKETPPMHVNIVEDRPLTSVPVGELKRGQCKWPTNDAATEACGASISVGAYCPRHAVIAYQAPPTAKRNALFHRKNQYD
jgi:hypothetical protein